jgi:hypothetical protein
MVDRETDDTRLQRLADLSIEIRMLKARVQAEMDEHTVTDSPRAYDTEVFTFRSSLSAASCPHCGHTAGLALLPREHGLLPTLVRCFACHRDSAGFEWVAVPPHDSMPDHSNRGTGLKR